MNGGRNVGYWKHRFEGMTPEEQERVDHAELLQYAAPDGHLCAPGLPCPGEALRKFHDRKYGLQAQCEWCQEPQREATSRALDRIGVAFARQPATPQQIKPTIITGSTVPINPYGKLEKLIAMEYERLVADIVRSQLQLPTGVRSQLKLPRLPKKEDGTNDCS